MKKILLPLLLLVFSVIVPAQTEWKLDKSHSNVRFTVKHLVISEVEGYFRNFNGTMTSAKEDFTDAKINFTVDAGSINTENEKRDNHLRSDDFFNAEKFPEMIFKSTSFSKTSENKYSLKGDLTIRDVTKPVVFDVTFGGIAEDGYGNLKAAFKAVTTVNRFDYDLKWNAITEMGGAVVGKDVVIDLRLQFGSPKPVVGMK